VNADLVKALTKLVASLTDFIDVLTDLTANANEMLEAELDEAEQPQPQRAGRKKT
jgi:hypothetical protein